MKVMNRLEVISGLIHVNIVLTESEVRKLLGGSTINNEDDDQAEMQIQIVGYGEEMPK